MSFSRAKVTRFNDAIESTPSPADYNVKLLEKNGKGAVIPKSDRFVDVKSPANSECSNSAQGSVQSTPACFRTPTLPKKKKTIFTLSGRKPKPSDLFSKKKKGVLSDLSTEDELDLEALKDKIVECHNKDIFIKDLTEQIEEMKAQLNDLEMQKEKLTQERYKFEETCNELREEHKIMIQTTFLDYDTETNGLKQQIYRLEEALLHEQEAVKLLRHNAQTTEAEMTERILTAEVIHEEATKKYIETLKIKECIVQELQGQIANLEERVASLRNDHEAEVSALQKKHKEEIMDLEFTMLKSITETQNLLEKEKTSFEKRLATMSKQHSDEKSKILEETTAKIKQIEEDSKEATVLADIQMQERCKDIELTWKLTLNKQRDESSAILEECQAISEYSITQCEWEKNEIKNKLALKIEELKKFEHENADLNIALEETDLKCTDLLKDIENLKQNKMADMEKNKKELQELLQQKKLYEISITKAHETIDTLKKRLLDSDHDVEQLKGELETCELSKLEFEARCNQLRDELDLVGKQSDAIEAEYHDTLKQTDDRIATLEIELIQKVEEYKAEASKQIHNLLDQLHDKECELLEVLDQLHSEHAVNRKAQNLIQLAQQEIESVTTENNCLNVDLQDVKIGFATLQKQFDDAEVKIGWLEIENGNLCHKLNEKEEIAETLAMCEKRNEEVDGLLKQLQQMQEKTDSYQQYCDYYKIKSAEYEAEIDQLDGINKKYIEQSGKYDSLLQKYELLERHCADLEIKTAEQDALIGPFREQLEQYDLERNFLVSQKAAAEDEAKKMGVKYAQLLGHQNQKQKIKHMIDLKSKNQDLAAEKKELELKLKSHAKTIEKLNKQLSSMQLHSPRKSKLHVSDKENVASPNRTLNNSRVESPGPLRERN